MVKLIITSTLAAMLVWAVGCSPQEDSSNIKTAGIYFEFEVTDSADKAEAVATFWVGNKPGGTVLNLSGGDEIKVNGVRLSEQRGFNPIRYAATLDKADKYDFVFTRPDEDPYSSLLAQMPKPVVITGPPASDIARDKAFEVTWEDNSADSKTIELLIGGDCFWDYPDVQGDDVADSGSYSVASGGLKVKDLDKGETCAATVRLKRKVNGVLCDSLKGTIKGYSVDTSSFNSTPAADEASTK